jgi:predicted  nucleic acid-binding Zn-ribbon protein
MGAVKQIGSSDVFADTHQLEALSERLLHQQPQSQQLLKRLLAGSHRAFAPVHDGRCSACNVTIATARIQQAKAGKFINCANCIAFLYYDPL